MQRKARRHPHPHPFSQGEKGAVCFPLPFGEGIRVRAAQGGSLCERRNAAMRRPDHLPEGFAPESTLDCVALPARRTTTRRHPHPRSLSRNWRGKQIAPFSCGRRDGDEGGTPCQPRFWCERVPPIYEMSSIRIAGRADDEGFSKQGGRHYRRRKRLWPPVR
jgi:hypothetical protein